MQGLTFYRCQLLCQVVKLLFLFMSGCQAVVFIYVRLSSCCFYLCQVVKLLFFFVRLSSCCFYLCQVVKLLFLFVRLSSCCFYLCQVVKLLFLFMSGCQAVVFIYVRLS